MSPSLPRRRQATSSTARRRRTIPTTATDTEAQPGHQQRRATTIATSSKAGAAGARVLLLLRAAASVTSFVAVALVASCRHGDWMEFARYPEYRALLGAALLACVYSAAQALRAFRRMRGRSGAAGLADFAGDQVVAYLLLTASAAALPITLRMRSAVLNVFTDAITAAISLAFIAFAALAMSAMLSGFTLISAAAAAQPY